MRVLLDWPAAVLVVSGAVLLFAFSAGPARNIYVAQKAVGSANGTDCADAYAVAFFNTAANWGTGAAQIGPGTTVHACGTITNNLVFQGSGTSGSPVTLLFEPGAKLSQPAGQLINIQNKSWITIDGGSPCGPGTVCSTTDSGTAILENTANGTGLANQLAEQAILASGAGNIEVRNLIIRNIYQHTSVSDTTISAPLDNCYYANGATGPVSFHDITAHDVGWCVAVESVTNSPTINMYNNNFYNYDHGVAIATPDATNFAVVNIHDNHFGTTANWDTTVDQYHHDGTHFFAGTTWASSWSFNVYNNLFDGNWGNNNTANIFTQEDPPNLVFFNNVFIQAAGNLINNGLISAGGPNTAIYNNTFLGSSVTLSDCVSLQGATSVTFKNNVLSGCNTFITSGSGFTFASGGLSNNIYAAVAAGGNGPFNYQGNNEATFAAWQTATGQDAAPSAQVSSANLNNLGIPQSGSAVIGAGLNLTSLGITALDSDTSAGNTRTPVARPPVGSTLLWSAGAYQFGGTSAVQPASGLTAVAH